MSSERLRRGREGEALAACFLAARGYRLLARNVHLRVGELDLIALDGETLCFVEVRLRSSSRLGSAEESIDGRKRQRLMRAARAALATLRLPGHRAVRFDVVAIDASRRPPGIRLIRDAF
jgi:putative endonuclease